MYCWSLAWRILSITLLACERSAIVRYFELSLALRFFGIGMKTDLFQSCGHCWVFQICWHIECSTFTASSFRTWNSSTGILSPPLALFVVMLPKAHSTSHSRMSGSRWVITPSWLSGSWRSFLYRSSVYSCHLFLILKICHSFSLEHSASTTLLMGHMVVLFLDFYGAYILFTISVLVTQSCLTLQPNGP